MPPITRKEFAAKVKAKYPDYSDIDDNVLVDKMVAKYPEYQEQISDFSVTQKKNPLPTTSKPSTNGVSPIQSTSNGVGSDFYNAVGGNKFPTTLQAAHSEDKNWAGNLWNRVVSGTEGIMKGASDNVFNAMISVLPESVVGAKTEEAKKLYREEVIPQIGGKATGAIKANVTPQEKENFDKGIISGAIGGLAESLPAIVSPKGTKGAALFMQAYDGALKSINSTEEGAKLPESDKTSFAVVVGGAQAALEKFGLDKIFGKQSTKVATKLAARSIADLVKKSTAPITAEMADQAIMAAAKTLKQKVVNAGGKITTGALVEFGTGSLQEAATILAETITNKATGKEVFEKTSFGDKVKRVATSGAMEAIGGGILGTAAIPFSKTRNYIAEKVATAKTPEDIEMLKSELVAQAPNLSEEQVAAMGQTIDNYVRVNSKIPEGTANRKEVAEKIIEREEIETELEKKTAQVETVDAAFQPEIKKDIEILTNRANEINEEISKAEEAPKTEQPTVSEAEIDLSNKEQVNEVFKKQWDAANSEQILANDGEPVQANGGIIANGLKTLTDKKWGHGSDRQDNKGSLQVLDNLLGGGDFKGDFGTIGTGAYNARESGKFVIATDNPNTINDTKKLNPKEVEIILNDQLSPFGQALKNKYPDFVIKDYNGKEFKAQQPTVSALEIGDKVKWDGEERTVKQVNNDVVLFEDGSKYSLDDITKAKEHQYKQKVGSEVTKVSGKVQQQAQDVFDAAQGEIELQNNKTQVAEGKGSWRKEFNETKDAMRKKDILSAVADASTDRAELAEISEATKGLPEGLHSEINNSVEHKLKALNEKAKATDEVSLPSKESKPTKTEPISDSQKDFDEKGKVIIDNEKDYSEGYPYLAADKITEHGVPKDMSFIDKIKWGLWRRGLIQDKLGNTRGENVKNKGVKWANDAAGKAKSMEVRELLAQREIIDNYIQKQLPSGYDKELGDFTKYTDAEKKKLVEEGVLPKSVIKKLTANEVPKSTKTEVVTKTSTTENKQATGEGKTSEEGKPKETVDFNERLVKKVDSEIEAAKNDLKAAEDKLAGYKANNTVAYKEGKAVGTFGQKNRKAQLDKIKFKRDKLARLEGIRKAIESYRGEGNIKEALKKDLNHIYKMRDAKSAIDYAWDNTESIENEIAKERKVTKPAPKKQSVLERPKEEVTIDDVLGELLGDEIGESDLANKTLKDKDGGVETYIDAAKKVLKGLYPKAALKAFKTDAEYVAAGGKEGTRGFAKMNKNGEHEILLNLEVIAETNSNKTVFHEVIHPIVYDAFGLKPEELTPIWNDLAKKMQDVPGMESVFDHISEYAEHKKAAEGLTEMLTQIAKGNIDLKAVPKSTANQIIELINKVFEAVGLDFKIKSIDDFAEISKKVKEAFETGETKGLEKVVKRGGIDKAVKKLEAADIDPTHRQKLIDLLKQKVETELKAGNITESEAKKIYEKAGIKEEKAEPPKTPPSEPKAEGKVSGGALNDKAILNRLNEAKGTPEEARKGFAEKGLKYEPSSQKEAEGIAKTIIDEVGMEDALLLAGAGKFKGDTNSLIFAESLNRLAEQESKAKTPEEKLAAAQRYAEVAIEYDEAARDKGRFISAINYFYKKSALGIKLVEKTRREEAFKDWFKNKDKSAKEFFDEMMKEPEFSDLVKEKVDTELKKERADARAKRRQKIVDIFDKAKLSKGATYATIIPPDVINGAIEVMKQATLAGESVVHVVGKAVEHISKQMAGKSWDKDKFQKEWEEKLKGIDDEGGKSVPKNSQEKVIERFRKKLKGVDAGQKDKIIRASFKKLVENGALKYEDFKQIIAETLGYGEMTEAESAKLEQLVNDINQVEEIGRKSREGEKTLEKLQGYRDAKKKAEKSATELGQIVYSKPDITNRLLSIMQLNTLGIPSLVNNPIFNVWNQATVRFPIGLQLTAIDQILYHGSKVSNRMFGTDVIFPENNIFIGQREFWRKLGTGAKQSTEQLFTGLTNADYFQKEVKTSQIHPFTSAKELWQSFKGEKPLTKAQKTDKAIQATVGIPAEIVARSLNIGDKPQRFAAEGGQGAVFAKNLGLKGIDYEYFMEFPKEEAYMKYKAMGLSDATAMKKAEQIQERIIKQGEESTFQQDNLLNDALNAAFKPFGTAGEVVKKFNMPFVKIPLNAFWSVYNLVNPEVAFMQSMVYGAKAFKTKSPLDIQQSKKWFAHGVTGLATMAIAGALAKEGIISPSNDDDTTKKERQGERTYEQQNSVDVNKLRAYLQGKDPNEVENGLNVDLKWFGNVGQVMNFQAKKLEDMTPEQKENGLDFSESIFQNMAPSALDLVQNGVFSNTSSLLTALGKGGQFADSYLLNLMNMATNIVHPAMFAQMSRAQLPYYTKQKADTFYEEVKSNMLARSSILRNITGQNPKASVGAWGDRLDRPDNVMLKLFGISKNNKDNFAQPLYEDYKKTGNTKFLPPAVMPRVNGQALTVKESEQLETLVGQARKNMVAPYVNDMATLAGFKGRYSKLNEEDKLSALEILYEEGFNVGRDRFIALYPKYAKEEKSKEEKADTKERKKFRKSIK